MHNVLVIAGYTLLGVFIATLLFQFNPVMSVILVSVKLMIHFESFGMMQPIGTIWMFCAGDAQWLFHGALLSGAKLNGFSLANLIIAIGLSVEFTAHVAREFLLQTGSRTQRVQQALVVRRVQSSPSQLWWCFCLPQELFAPVTYGALCSFLPLIPLAFAKYVGFASPQHRLYPAWLLSCRSRFPFFRLYYFALYSLMVLFTWGNGVFFLPVVLSFIGPAAMDLEDHAPGEVAIQLTTLSPDDQPPSLKEDRIDIGNPLPTPHGRP
jgi:Patched family